MLKAERQQKILNILNNEQKVIASELSTRLKVSEDTIRRDLKDLDNQNLVRRVHSGALRVGPPITDFKYRTTIEQQSKNEIAAKAFPFLKEGSVILVDGSTTNLTLIEHLPTEFQATIITNSPPIAIALASHRNIDVINLGGDFYKRSMINVGIETYRRLDQIRADLYIMGISNIDLNAGTSVPTTKEADIKRKMISISGEVLGMATPDKFGSISTNIVCAVDDLSYLITTTLPQNVKREYSKKQITLL